MNAMNARFLRSVALAIAGPFVLAGCTAGVSLRSETETHGARLISRQSALAPDFSSQSRPMGISGPSQARTRPSSLAAARRRSISVATLPTSRPASTLANTSMVRVMFT